MIRIFQVITAALGKAFSWLLVRFTRDELYAVKGAMAFPLFSMFVFFTRWVWLLLLALLVVPIGYLLLMEMLLNGNKVAGVANAILSLSFLALVAPWFFGWFIVCFWLTLGRSELAQEKEKKLTERLARLTRTEVLTRPEPPDPTA